MRERLSSTDIRFVGLCLLLLAGSVWFSAKFFYRAFPEASIDFAVTRDRARGLAERFVAAQGERLEGYRQASRFDFDERAKTFLERELGLDQANRIMGSRVRLWHWSYRWFRPLQKEEYRVDISPRGETVGYRRLIEEEAAGASLSGDQARAVAEGFLRSRMQRDPATLEAVDAVSTVRRARVDHVFTWKERDFSVKDATYRREVTIAGDRVAGYREYLKIPETWLRDYDRLRSRNEVAQMVDTALMVLLALGALVTLLIRIGNRDVRWGRAVAFAGTGAALILLSSWNEYPLAEFGYPTTDSYGSFLARRLMQTLAGALGGGALIFALTAAAEPLYRQWFGSQISLGNLFRRRGLRTKRFFLGTVLGLALTGLFVAYQTVFYLVAYRFGAWSPADVPYSDLLNTRLPWLFVLLGGFLPAVGEEFLFRMFAIPFLRLLVRFTGLAVVLAGLLWGFGHSAYPQQPFYIRGVEVGIGGVVLGLIMLRWGILPTLVWHYSVDALYTALLLLRSHNLYFILSGAASAGVMVLPLLVAWIAYLRGGGFEPEADLTNQHEGTTAPAAPVAVGAESPPEELPYEAWSPRRRATALLLLAGLAGLLLLPVKRFPDFSSFALNAPRAVAAADGFLRQQGMDPRSFRSVVYVENELSRPSACCGPGTREVGKYFLERRSPSDLKEACQRLVPLHSWNVRYYKPLEKEDLRVSLHPETGQVIGFQHNLPEDQPGAELPPETARKIASDYVSGRGFDLSAFELKETTSERKKARLDHTLVWEARAGDPRNVEEARYRVRVQVAGDRVVALRTLWKLPETFMRERNRRNALSNTLLGVTLVSIAALVVAGLFVLIRQTRKRQLRWRSALGVSLAVTALAALGEISRFPLLFRHYNTAMPLRVFEATQAAGAVISLVFGFLMSAYAAGIILALRPAALTAFRVENRRRLGIDALLAAALGLALGFSLGHLRGALLERFHQDAFLPTDAPEVYAAAVPALSIVASASTQALWSLALLALAVYLLGSVRRPRWLAVPLSLLALVAAVPGQVHTMGEFALQYGILVVGAGALVAYLTVFGRNNYLTYGLAVWSWAMGRRAMDFLAQPGGTLQQQGWMVAAVLVITAAWVVAPALIQRRRL